MTVYNTHAETTNSKEQQISNKKFDELYRKIASTANYIKPNYPRMDNNLNAAKQAVLEIGQ